jgi:hypothetical protein
MTVPRCSVCKRALVGARAVVNDRWVCGDCLYEREHGPSPRREREGRTSITPTETLFQPRDAA